VSSPVLAAVESALVERFGGTPQRASVSFVGVEPIEVLRFEPVPGERAYVSLGMSRHPMTGADASMLAAEGPRAELLLELRDPTDRFSDVWRRLAVLAAAPAVEGVVYSPGMSIDLGEPLVAGSAVTGVIVTESAVGDLATAEGPVTVLRAWPATSTELAWCRVRGSEALRERWVRQGVDGSDILRGPAALD
jgi:hypothetical protein